MSGAAAQRRVVGVVGAGLIGGSIAKRLAATHAVIVHDRRVELRAAVEAAGIGWADNLQELAQDATHVFVAITPRGTVEAVVELLRASSEVLVADTASVKGPVVEEIQRLASDAELRRFQPLHPLAGSQFQGWEHAERTLLDEAPWAICPVDAGWDAVQEERLSQWSALIDDLAGYLVPCTLEAHDAAVAVTSHMPHVVSSELAAQVGAQPGLLGPALSGGGLRDMTRIAASTGPLWDEIVQLNRGATLAALDDLIARLQGQRAVIAGDAPQVDLWSQGAQAAAAIKATRWDDREWHRDSLPQELWPHLLELGRQGCGLRELRRSPEGGVTAEVSQPVPRPAA